MAARFPAETRFPANHFFAQFDHLIAVDKRNIPGELRPLWGVATDSKTKQIYVAGGGTRFARVSIFSETGEFLNSFTHKHMKEPWGISIRNDNIYVTDYKAHFVFHFKLKVDIDLVGRIGGEGSDIEKFKHPSQLTVSTKGDVYVADCFNHRIQILDRYLHWQRHISHHSMKYPCDVKLTLYEVYVISDRGELCVHVFSYAGDKIRSLITLGYGMQVNWAQFFCLDANGNIFISDRGTNKIKIFSKEGTLIHSLGEPGHEAEMFDHPCGIALTENLKLVIASHNSNYLMQIFSD